MTKPNPDNERIKRKHYIWLKEAHGRSGSTLSAIEKTLWLFEQYTGAADFRTFTPDQAIDFKKWILERKGRNGTVAVSTLRGYTIQLRQFFKWLSQQPGYRRLTPDKADYFRLSNKDERMARQTAPRSYPGLDYFVSLASSIKVSNEIDLRDRALIAFTFLSGMRDHAVVSLRLGCFDKNTLAVIQDPKRGVVTKRTKLIPSVLFRFNEELLGFVLEWYGHLERKGYGSEDPLFPRSKISQGPDHTSFESSTEIEQGFWAGTGPMRTIVLKRCADAKLPYFPPQSYRHAAANVAMSVSNNPSDIKAISQNLGHKYVATMLESYGTLSVPQMADVVQKLKPSGGSPDKEEIKRRLIELTKML